MCSNTYRPLVVVSFMAVVFVVLTTPFTRKETTATIRMHATVRATTATIRMHATVRATTISTTVIPCSCFLRSIAPSPRPDLFTAETPPHESGRCETSAKALIGVAKLGGSTLARVSCGAASGCCLVNSRSCIARDVTYQQDSPSKNCNMLLSVKDL